MREFTYQKYRFCISEEVENFANEVKRMYAIQEEAEEKLRTIYKQYSDMDTAIKKLEMDCNSILREITDHYVQRWIDSGFYELSLESFIRDYVQPEYGNDALALESAYEQIRAEYNDIVMTQEQKEEYRRLRKAGRGRWVGGGFGLANAVSGAATAGMMNAASGLGHGVVNAIGNLGTSIAAAGKKRKLYENQHTLDLLLEALSEDAGAIFRANIEFAENNVSLTYKRITIDACEKASAIISNIRSRDISEEEFEKIVKQIFDLNPYDIEFYRLLLLKYGDEKYELDELAKFFSCGQMLKTSKLVKFNEIYLQADKAEEYESYKTLLLKMEKAATFYGIDKKNKLLQTVREKCNELELKERTFEGIVFDTIEMAEEAKKEKADLERLFNEIDLSDEDSLKIGIDSLEAYEATVYSKNVYLDRAKGELDKRIYESEEKILKEILQNINSLNKDSLEEAEKKLKQVEFTKVNKQKYLNEVQDDIKNFSYNIRKVEGVLYDTVEEAEKARQEVKFYTELLQSITVNNYDSILTAIENLKAFNYTYVNSQKYIAQAFDFLYEFRMEEVRKQWNDFLENKNYKEALNAIYSSNIPDGKKKQLMGELNTIVKEKFKTKLTEAEQYKTKSANKKEELNSTLLGMVLVLVIGAFLTKFFSSAFKIAVVLVAFAVLGLWMEKREIEKFRKSYEEINELKQMGFEL